MKKLKIVFILLLAVGFLTGCGCTKQEEQKITYQIIFDTDGGSTIPAQNVQEGSLISKPADPTKAGYTFDGWEYDGADYFFTSTVSKNMILKAKWAKVATRYTVKFNSDGGSTVYSVTVKEGEKVSRPTDPTKEGYILKTWTLNEVEYNFDTPVTSNIELKAVWEVDVSLKPENQEFTVTFDSDGGSEVPSQKIKYNKKATKPANPTLKGYVFLDWTLDDKIFSFSTKITADITLKATWAKEGTYTVTFDTNGSTDVIESQKYKAGKLITKPTDPTKEGYVLKEWQYNGVAWDFAINKVAQDMTLKAIWALPRFTVTFNTDGGSTVKAQSIEINKTATKPKTNPTKTGYNFLGWFVGEEEYDFSTPITADITITAKWEAKKFTVTFDSDNGSEPVTQEYEYNSVVVEPANPTKEGYEFNGWYNGTTKYKFTEKVTKNITLKAKWTKEAEKTYTFNYESIEQAQIDNGGISGTNDVTVKVYENNKQINFKAIKLDGYTLCEGTNPTVNLFDIKGKTTVTVILTNDKSVTATYKK